MLKWGIAILIAQILILIVQIFLFVPQFSANLINKTGATDDAITIASQIGRLDVISLVMAMFGIILALLAFFGFFSIKNHAEQVAVKVANETLNKKSDELDKMVNAKIDWFDDKFQSILPDENGFDISQTDLKSGAEQLSGDSDG